MHVDAYRDIIDPHTPCDIHHATASVRVGALVAAMREHGWQGPPVLLAEQPDSETRYYILDGHHRIEAARQHNDDPTRGEDITVEAWVVAGGDLQRILDADFGGELPTRIADLDPYIYVDGAPYTGRCP